jgi:hypothetical protein
MQNYCITYRCLKACTGTQMKVVWIKLWIFLHSKAVNKNNSMQLPLIYSLMAVWFETFHREITSLSAEKYETQGAYKVHWTLTLEVMTSSIKLIVWHTQTDAMLQHSRLFCWCHQCVTDFCVVHIGTVLIFSACECHECSVIIVWFITLCSQSLCVSNY